MRSPRPLAFRLSRTRRDDVGVKLANYNKRRWVE